MASPRRLTNTALPSPPPLQGDVGLPLYRRLVRTLAGEIAVGHLKPGDALPAEAELARRYAIAPGTVRRAMEDLAGRGLIERIHGRGTFVRRPNFDNAMLRFFRFRDSAGAVIHPESRIVSRGIVPMSAPLAARLSTTDRMAIHVLRHRLWEGAVRLTEDIYLPASRFEAMLTVAAGEIGPLLYPAYERLCGVVVFSIEEEIAISAAGPAEAHVLGIAPGSPIVTIERLAKDAAGHPLEWRLSRAEAARFRYRVTSDTP